jgi:hypothetical protein
VVVEGDIVSLHFTCSTPEGEVSRLLACWREGAASACQLPEQLQQQPPCWPADDDGQPVSSTAC